MDYKKTPNEKEHSFDYLKQFDQDVIVTLILENFNEEEKKDILRNQEFILMMDSNSLNKIINSMSFISVFNMLQNKELLDKLTDINVNLTTKDTLFIKEFLNSNLFLKANHNMLKKMLITMPKEDIINNLNNKDLVTKLDNDDLIEICSLKHIDLINDIYLIEMFDKEEIEKYINEYFKTLVNYKLIDNTYVKNILFNEDIDLSEVFYLYDLITTKSNHNIKDIHHSLSSFMAVYNLYKKDGLDKCIKKFNKKGISLDDIKVKYESKQIKKIR